MIGIAAYDFYRVSTVMIQTEKTLKLVLDGGSRNPICYEVTLTMEPLEPRFC